MTVMLAVAALLILGCAIILLTSRTILSLSYQNRQISGSLLVLRCGIIYDGGTGQFGIAFGRFLRYFKPKAAVSSPPKKPKRVLPPKRRRRLPSLSTIIATIRAVVLFAGRILSHVRVDEAKFDLQPMIANPALAGMAYGWSQAFYGVFPSARKIVSISPDFGDGESVISGRVTFSIANRRILLSVWELLWNLPIKELVRYIFSKRGV